MAHRTAGEALNTGRDRAIVWAIGAALVGSAWLLDPGAQAGFDAPKRFAVLAAAACGLVALAWPLALPAWRTWSRPARLAALFAALAMVGLLVATLAAEQTDVAWDALRTIALYAVFVPLGASLANGAPVAVVAAVAIGVNALLSLAQASGVELPIPLAQLGGRYPTGALLGNEAYVAIACALLAAACIAVALNATTRRVRLGAITLVVLAVATIAVNRQITASVALAAGIAAIVAVRVNARRLVPIGAGIVALALASAAVPALRSVTWGALPLGVEAYQRATTYRLGAWAAADEMIAARSWTGYGPGSYASQAQPHRLAAELRLRERLIPPPPSSAFVYAHQDYLQLAAEAGAPTLVAVLAALALVLGRLLRLARSPGPAEALALVGVLVAGAVAALAWFPLQIPLVAIVLLVACGRAWRLVAEAAP